MARAPELHADGGDLSLQSDADARFFRDFVASSRSAVAGRPSQTLRVAGRTLRVSFASDTLAAALAPATAHLLARHVEQGPAALEILVWDSDGSGLEPPLAPWQGQGFASWARARAVVEHPVTAHLCGHGTFSLLDREQRLGVYWVRSVQQIPPWDRAAPFRSLFGMWAPSIDGALLHAAAVGEADGALLLTGKGGSGKSTTALSCLLEGMSFLGEDYVLVTGRSAPRVHSLYATAKLDPSTFARLFAAGTAPPSLDPGPCSEAFDHRKHILALHEAHAGSLLGEAPVRALIVPHVSESGATTLSPLPAPAVLRALAPTTLLQLPGSDERSFARLADLVRALPGYALALGERAKVVATLRGLLHSP